MWMGALIPWAATDDRTCVVSHAPANDTLGGAGPSVLAGSLLLAAFVVGALSVLRRPLRLAAAHRANGPTEAVSS